MKKNETVLVVFKTGFILIFFFFIKKDLKKMNENKIK